MSDAAENVVYLDSAAVLGEPLDASPDQRALLDRINRKIAAAESLDDVMTFLFESSRQVCPCDRIGLSFVEDQGRRVVARWARALYEPILLQRGYAEDLQGSTLDPVLLRNQVRIIRDLDRYLLDHPRSRSTRVLAREGVRSSMTCPLRVEGRIVGFLFRSSRRPAAFEPRHARLHLEVAERLSQTVEKAWRIEQLTEATRAYAEMLGFVSHELKSPVASIVTDARLMADGYLGDLAPAQRDKLQRICVKGEHLLGLVREYLDLARIEGADLKPALRPCDVVAEVLLPAIEFTHATFEQSRVTLDRALPAGLPRVECDPDLLQIVAVNLLGNAAKYGRPGGRARIVAETESDRLRVRVWNEGPGFPPEQRNRLFKRFSRVQTPELLQRKGTGVGLYTCWRIIEAHRGRIGAESEPGQWAEFAFDLPLVAGATTG